jgi:hypothetical protein
MHGVLLRNSRFRRFRLVWPNSRFVAALTVLCLLTAQKPAFSQTLTKLDTDLVDDMSRRAFRYFADHTNPRTGLVLDRAPSSGGPEERPNQIGVASIAATGFGLTAFCIAADHKWVGREMARQRVVAALRFFALEAPQANAVGKARFPPSTQRCFWLGFLRLASISTAIRKSLNWRPKSTAAWTFRG